MLPLVSGWFDRNCHPIGIDFGTDCLRLAQVQPHGSDFKLVAAASVDVPESARDNADDRLSFLSDVLGDLISSESFRGHRAVLALPAASAFIQHVTLAPFDERKTEEAVMSAVRTVLPIDAEDTLIRHQAINESSFGQRELIAVGASRPSVVNLIAAIQAADLDVVAMNTELGAVTDFYRHTYRRYTDLQSTTCVIDLGYSGSRMMVMRDEKLVMACTIPQCGREMTKAVSDGLRVDLSAARLLRLKHSRSDAIATAHRERHVLFVAPSSHHSDEMHAEHVAMDHATQPIVHSLIRAIRTKRDEFEKSDIGSRIDRILFIGGESRDRRLCESIARSIGITAALGDPLLRMGHENEICVSSGIDRRQAQPAWAVAVGLSCGPVDKPAKGTANESHSDGAIGGRR